MRTDPSCIFCKIVGGEIPCFKLLEDEFTLAFMDVNPANPGHALAISKEHWEDVYAIPDSLIGAVTKTAKQVARAIKHTLDPDGINLVQANGKGAAQSVFHFHMHVLPRDNDDDLKLNWGPRPGDMEQIKQVCERIKAAV
ncbi:MAG: HIT family protein [Gammaproteobacteria bacterium]|nr:HIT family protein [Gammaproteobacteria bacterium]